MQLQWPKREALGFDSLISLRMSTSGIHLSTSTSNLENHAVTKEPFGRRLRGAVLRSTILIGTVAVIFGSLQNTLTFYLRQFWGGAGDIWQTLWSGLLNRVRADLNMTIFTCIKL